MRAIGPKVIHLGVYKCLSSFGSWFLRYKTRQRNEDDYDDDSGTGRRRIRSCVLHSGKTGRKVCVYIRYGLVGELGESSEGMVPVGDVVVEKDDVG